MSEQGLDEIVQITVEDFNQEDRTGEILVKQHEKLIVFLLFIDILCLLIHNGHVLCWQVLQYKIWTSNKWHSLLTFILEKFL